MKKIKKQRLSLESTVVRDLSSEELATVGGASAVSECIPIIRQETKICCAKCTGGYSGCYNVTA